MSDLDIPRALSRPLKAVPVGTVSCPSSTGQSSGAWFLSNQKIAPSVSSMPESTDHEPNEMPVVLRPPSAETAEPSSEETVSHESYWVSGLNCQSCGFVPPTSAPNGVGT